MGFRPDHGMWLFGAYALTSPTKRAIIEEYAGHHVQTGCGLAGRDVGGDGTSCTVIW